MLDREPLRAAEELRAGPNGNVGVTYGDAFDVVVVAAGLSRTLLKISSGGDDILCDVLVDFSKPELLVASA